MKKIIYLSAIALASVFTTTSCGDFLDAENKAAGLTTDQYYSTPEGLATYRADVYYALRALATNTDINEWGTDLYLATRGRDPGDLHKYTLTPEDGVVKNFFVNCYSMINKANGVIDFGGEDSQYIDEAKFLRCYGYYLLTQQFGGVPYITNYVKDPSAVSHERNSVEEVYKGVIAELESIANSSKLPENSLGANLGIASKRAVAALLAKVYLAAGWDLQTSLDNAEKGTYTVNSTEYFKKAAEWADKAIGGQALTMSFADKWAPANENNDEEIFSVQYQRQDFPGDILKGGHGLQNGFGSYYGTVDETGLKACGSVLAPTAKALYLWDKGDERWDGTFMSVMFNSTPDADKKPAHWGVEGYYAYYNTPNAINTLNIALVYLPCYTTKAEAQDFITAHQNQFKNAGWMHAEAKVFIMSDPVTTYIVRDGAIQSTSDKAYKQEKEDVNGSVTVKKYDDPATEMDRGNTTTDYRDILLFHVSDMYLTAAEAYLMAGDQATALARVNAVRSRAKATTLASFGAYEYAYAVHSSFGAITPLDVILDEKARETFGENEGRWLDLRRTKQLVRYNIEFNEYISTVADISNNLGEIKWLRPIPQAEINSNSGMSDEDQNPGY